MKDRPAKNPGGCECSACGVIFIGEEWHELCGDCFAKAETKRIEFQDVLAEAIKSQKSRFGE